MMFFQKRITVRRFADASSGISDKQIIDLRSGLTLRVKFAKNHIY